MSSVQNYLIVKICIHIQNDKQNINSKWYLSSVAVTNLIVLNIYLKNTSMIVCQTAIYIYREKKIIWQ